MGCFISRFPFFFLLILSKDFLPIFSATSCINGIPSLYEIQHDDVVGMPWVCVWCLSGWTFLAKNVNKIPKSQKVFVCYHNMFWFGFDRVTLVASSCGSLFSLGRAPATAVGAGAWTLLEKHFAANRFRWRSISVDFITFTRTVVTTPTAPRKIIACVCAFMLKEGRRLLIFILFFFFDIFLLVCVPRHRMDVVRRTEKKKNIKAKDERARRCVNSMSIIWVKRHHSRILMSQVWTICIEQHTHTHTIAPNGISCRRKREKFQRATRVQWKRYLRKKLICEFGTTTRTHNKDSLDGKWMEAKWFVVVSVFKFLVLCVDKIYFALETIYLRGQILLFFRHSLSLSVASSRLP